MTERDIARLELQVDLDQDPIAGLVHHGDLQGMPFSGWMELSRTIELSLDEARRRRRETSGGTHA
jgi:hypothetical protein